MIKFGVFLFAVLLPVLVSFPAQADSPPLPSKKQPSTASTEFKTADLKATNLKSAYFGAGCFWKVQYIFSNAPGVVKTTVGYTGGTIANPTYQQVCSHSTKHVETVQVEYDPKKTTFKKLLEVFWSHHDPTTLNRQGPDVGDQYRSVIFYTDNKQKDEALRYMKELNTARRFPRPIVTAIEPAGKFYDAEEYHQDYFKKHGQVCQ
ncbi:MAG: peptide-methionine (S)-S-oxide reductase MsrA [Candidatus Melainabacteria bacterium]|nr:peptide-methionine (S)-S-oxide reductase MsrA [Candidatus Melainabacteria bacterium]